MTFSEIKKRFPSLENEFLRKKIAALLKENNIRIVVLDDDPTGIQTVHGNYLLTNWIAENIAVALDDSVPFFYVLTNTRALSAEYAKDVVCQVVNKILDVNQGKYKIVFISRSDSTLRGHFPLEPQVMRREIERRGIPLVLPTVFTPVFFEAGRYTIDGVHVMSDGNDRLIPVAETEFARDNVFGYTHSDLAGYIREKSAACNIEFNDALHVALGDTRRCTIFDLEELLAKSAVQHKNAQYITFDALDYSDLRKWAYAILNTITKSGGSALLRTSSSMPKALSGIADQPLLDARTLGGGQANEGRGGLFVVGSHVKKTTAQLKHLLDTQGVVGFEIDIHEVLRAPAALLEKTEEALLAIHRRGETPVVYTSRQELRLDDAAERQQVGQRISDFLVDVVRDLRFRPDWLVAKGGITSHDILTRGLGIERARVLGQVLPGVPAVVTGAENRFPEMPYIIFPGNVGSETALGEIFCKLKG